MYNNFISIASSNVTPQFVFCFKQILSCNSTNVPQIALDNLKMYFRCVWNLLLQLSSLKLVEGCWNIENVMGLRRWLSTKTIRQLTIFHGNQRFCIFCTSLRAKWIFQRFQFYFKSDCVLPVGGCLCCAFSSLAYDFLRLYKPIDRAIYLDSLWIWSVVGFELPDSTVAFWEYFGYFYRLCCAQLFHWIHYLANNFTLQWMITVLYPQFHCQHPHQVVLLED